MLTPDPVAPCAGSWSAFDGMVESPVGMLGPYEWDSEQHKLLYRVLRREMKEWLLDEHFRVLVEPFARRDDFVRRMIDCGVHEEGEMLCKITNHLQAIMPFYHRSPVQSAISVILTFDQEHRVILWPGVLLAAHPDLQNDPALLATVYRGAPVDAAFRALRILQRHFEARLRALYDAPARDELERLVLLTEKSLEQIQPSFDRVLLQLEHDAGNVGVRNYYLNYFMISHIGDVVAIGDGYRAYEDDDARFLADHDFFPAESDRHQQVQDTYQQHWQGRPDRLPDLAAHVQLRIRNPCRHMPLQVAADQPKGTLVDWRSSWPADGGAAYVKGDGTEVEAYHFNYMDMQYLPNTFACAVGHQWNFQNALLVVGEEDL